MAKSVDNKGMIKPGEHAGQKITVDQAELIRTQERDNIKRSRNADGKIRTVTQQLKKLR